MQLPYSDRLNIGYLSRLYDNTSNCYKFFWFLAILGKLKETKCSFTYSELVNEMIADAWYMVTEYHLRLGPVGVTDNLEDVVKYISTNYMFRSSEKREKILEFLEGTDDRRIRKYKSDLTLNVPYRLQVPFYDQISIDRKLWYGSKQDLTAKINEQENLMYHFKKVDGLDTEIELDISWAEYLMKHKEILKCWTQLKLVHYLQNKNPSVPGIAEKIEPPASRDIVRVRKYWSTIIQIEPSIHEIYGNIDLSSETISVDHFVPWQFVAHDELWNLHPTTRSINSSKNNQLPVWTEYFERLSEIEYQAYHLKETNKLVEKEFKKCALYHLNNSEIRNQLYTPGLAKEEFKIRLDHVLRPVYDSAKNCGFREWKYSG